MFSQKITVSSLLIGARNWCVWRIFPFFMIHPVSCLLFRWWIKRVCRKIGKQYMNLQTKAKKGKHQLPSWWSWFSSPQYSCYTFSQCVWCERCVFLRSKSCVDCKLQVLPDKVSQESTCYDVIRSKKNDWQKLTKKRNKKRKKKDGTRTRSFRESNEREGEARRRCIECYLFLSVI